MCLNYTLPAHFRLCIVFVLILSCSSCAPSIDATPSHAPATDFASVPDEARISTRQGDPRTAGYWALWNTCAPENRADVAAANGGQKAGWILLDDLILDPGIQLGEYPVTTCEEGLTLLQSLTVSEGEGENPLVKMTAHLLTAELNLNAGAETCPIAEEAVLGGHIVLADIGFNGIGSYNSVMSDEITNAVPRLIELLEVYNKGELCR